MKTAWRHWVPVRLPDTIEVVEGIPDTAAAVLINRNHSWNDLYLPIDRRQAEWLEAMDGVRTLREIFGEEEDVEEGWSFAQRLLAYDQVVFDTSIRPPDTNP